jgi:hypothetical protein
MRSSPICFLPQTAPKLRPFYVSVVPPAMPPNHAVKVGNTPKTSAISYTSIGRKWKKAKFKLAGGPFGTSRHWPAHPPSPRFFFGFGL